jgi:DNA-binding NarL/FixJ family response regulator
LVLKSDADRDLLEAVEAVSKKRHFFTRRLSELVLGGYLAGTTPVKARVKGEAKQLTHREREVMRLLAGGMSSKEAAGQLQISIRTVESHRININRKLGFNSIANLVHYAIRHGIVAHT